MALTLHSRNIKCTVYESRKSPSTGHGALMLAPNALRLLDSLGIYGKLKGRGFSFSTVEFRDEHDSINDIWQMGNREKYGYEALRVSRTVFLDVLRDAITERNIEVKYAHEYSHVIQEDTEGVTFALKDGTEVRTTILVGADGIDSQVRKAVAPQVKPVYSGTLAIIAIINYRFSEPTTSIMKKPPQNTFYYGKSSAMLVLPQENDGSLSCLGTMRKYPKPPESDWAQLSNDKDKLYDIFMQNTDHLPERAQEALRQVEKTNMHIWPFKALPDLASWTTLPHRRVIVVGDAAHSIIPTGGQGACQAIEDAFTLAMVISNIAKLSSLGPESYARSIATWQNARQERVQKAKTFTKQIDNNKIPASERASLCEPGTYWEAQQHPDLSWLYGAGLANSQAKGVTRVAVQKQPTSPQRTRIRASSGDQTFGTGGETLVRGNTHDIMKGTC